MTETQRVLPPPTFLSRPEYNYSNFRPQLPGLQTLSFSHHGPPPPPPGSLPPMHTAPPVYGRDGSQSGQAVPISALLSDTSSEKNSRTDSIVQAPPMTSQLHHHHHSSPPFRFQGSARNPVQPPRSPTHQLYAPVPHASQVARPVFSHPFGPQSRHNRGSSNHSHYHHHNHRRRSSTCSPTSTVSSHPAFPAPEPPAAIPEHAAVVPAYTMPPRQQQPRLEYSLRMRQQPRAARACGFGERDRRVIDPPPIIELVARDPNTGEYYYESDSYTTLHCVLINAATGEDESQIPASTQGQPSAQRLMGNAVASPCVANDENGNKGSFFVFPDLSCRSPGKYKLLFRLLKIVPEEMLASVKTPIRANIESEAFEVFTAKEFPGMRASSALLRALRAQGLNVGVKKGSEASRRNARKKTSHRREGGGDSGDEGSEDDDDEGDSDEDEKDDSEDEEARHQQAKGKGKKPKSRTKHPTGPSEGEAGPSAGGKSRAKRLRSK